MGNIYSMGTTQWRVWIQNWIQKYITDYKEKYESPKWLTYKAILNQTGEENPVARVLNQDEEDYLGDILWQRNDVGIYTSFVSIQ